MLRRFYCQHVSLSVCGGVGEGAGDWSTHELAIFPRVEWGLCQEWRGSVFKRDISDSSASNLFSRPLLGGWR